MLKLVSSSTTKKEAAIINDLRHQSFLAFKGIDAFYGGSPQDYSAIKKQEDFPVTIDFDTANRHIVVFGASGTGKSSGVLRPASIRLIESGCSGMILDWKSDFHYLHRLYPYRVQLINPDVDMVPLNLLGGMTENEIIAFLDSVKTKLDSQPYFGSKVKSIVRFVIRTFFLLNRPVTLASIYNALAHPSGGFVEHFDELIRSNKFLPDDYLKMIHTQASDPFSILVVGNSRNLDRFKKTTDRKQTQPSDHAPNQYEWQVGCLKTVLEPFETNTRLRDYLCAERNSDDLCLKDLIYKDRKVLIVHLKPDQYGSAAPIVNRLLRTRFIAAMKSDAPQLLNDKDGLGRNWYTFMLADEYQNTCMLKSGDDDGYFYDDLAWFAEAREFGHINVIGLQGLSSLFSSCGNEKLHSVRTLIQNAGTVISFSSSDIETHNEVSSRAPVLQRSELISHLSSSLPVGTALVVCQFVGKQGAFKVSTDACKYAPWMKLRPDWLSQSSAVLSKTKRTEVWLNTPRSHSPEKNNF